MKGDRVTRFYVFVLRAILGAAFAVILMRVFYPRSPISYTMALWVFLVGMAYLLKYFRSIKYRLSENSLRKAAGRK